MKLLSEVSRIKTAWLRKLNNFTPSKGFLLKNVESIVVEETNINVCVTVWRFIGPQMER